MFLVFGWKVGRPVGGVNDLLKVFEAEDDALDFVERLGQTDARWEFHIANDELDIRYESALFSTPIESHGGLH